MWVLKQANAEAGFHGVEKGSHDWQAILAKDDADATVGSDDGCSLITADR